eukprot:773857-Amphidinium_carterae.3
MLVLSRAQYAHPKWRGRAPNCSRALLSVPECSHLGRASSRCTPGQEFCVCGRLARELYTAYAEEAPQAKGEKDWVALESRAGFAKGQLLDVAKGDLCRGDTALLQRGGDTGQCGAGERRRAGRSALTHQGCNGEALGRVWRSTQAP